MKRAIAPLVLLIGLAPGGIASAGPLEDADAANRRGDYATAVPLYRSLAEQGDARAQNSLGDMYANGRGVAKDDAEAVQWIRKAADQGFAEGQNNLAAMYATGRGVAKDDTQAVEWLRKAADQGLAGAQNNLGVMYRDGRIVTQDDAAAVGWFRKSAEQGFAPAQFNVGALYEKGAGVAQDYAEAARWYLKAAQQGQLEAVYNLGVLYEGGAGLARDLEEARKWYKQVMASPRADQASIAVKQHARERLETLSGVTEEPIPYQGGRFLIARSQEGTCVVALQGVVSRDATFKFDEVIARSTKLGCSKPWLLLESPGGGLLDGISLGRLVRQGDYRTVTRYACASACSMIFMGGTERVLVGSRAAIGLHQASVLTGKGNEHRCITSPMSDAARDIKRYLRWAIPAEADQVIEHVLGTSCDAVYWAQGQSALELGIATKLESENVDVFGPEEGRLGR